MNEPLNPEQEQAILEAAEAASEAKAAIDAKLAEARAMLAMEIASLNAQAAEVAQAAQSQGVTQSVLDGIQHRKVQASLDETLKTAIRSPKPGMRVTSMWQPPVAAKAAVGTAPATDAVEGHWVLQPFGMGQIAGRPQRVSTNAGNPRAFDTAVDAKSLLDLGITLLTREYNGAVVSVEVTPQGFVWCGQTFKSLSPIAGLVKGTPESGPRFFKVGGYAE